MVEQSGTHIDGTTTNNPVDTNTTVKSPVDNPVIDSSSLSRDLVNVTSVSGSGAPVVSAPGSSYNYTPSVIQNGDGSRDIYWGANENGRPGDSIFTAHAGVGERFSDPKAVYSSRALHDGQDYGGPTVHTCDPSVLDVTGSDGKTTRYLYTGTAPLNGQDTSAAGAVMGSDGTFHEMPLGSLVANSSHKTNTDPGNYGRGQPSVIHSGDYFYMAATDNGGADGIGSYMFRSRQPDFPNPEDAPGAGTQTLTSRGWETLTADNNTEHKLQPNDALDLAKDPRTGDILTITNGETLSAVYSWNADFTQQTRAPFNIQNTNVDESGFLRSGDGTLVGGLDNFTFYTATDKTFMPNLAPNNIMEYKVQTDAPATEVTTR